MASHPRPDTGNDDDPRVVELLTGREWIAPDYDPLNLIDLRVQQLMCEREDRKERLYAACEWFCVAIALITSVYFAVEFMR